MHENTGWTTQIEHEVAQLEHVRQWVGGHAQFWRATLWAACATVAANALFALFSLSLASLDPNPLVREVRHAFESGDLVPIDWLDRDAKRGANTYNECIILQMAINDAGGTMQKAFLPRIYRLDANFHGGCAALQQIVVGTADYGKLYQRTYSEYSHGYVPVGSILTRAAGVSGMRIILKASVYAALLFLAAIAIWASGRTAFLGASVAITGATIWALRYYGQNISYAPGDASIMLGLAVLIWARRKLSNVSYLAAASATYGAVLIYFDFLTGQTPTGAGLLFATVYALRRDAGDSERRAWVLATAALAAMATGALLTVVLKQLIVWSFAGSEGLSHFVNNAASYSGFVQSSESGFALYIHAFREAYQYLFVLTPRVRLLKIALAVTWLIAFAYSVRHRKMTDLGAFAFAALAAPAWIALAPSHFVQEPAFMVRILIVPIAIGLAQCAQALAATARIKTFTT